MAYEFTAEQEFSDAYARAEETQYCPEWANGTGYMDHAVRGSHAPHLLPGQVVRAMSSDNRRLLLIGTPIGNVIVFDRYSNGEDKVFVANMPRKLEHLLLRPSALNRDAMVCLLGVTPGQNIGHRLQALAEEISDLVVTA